MLFLRESSVDDAINNQIMHFPFLTIKVIESYDTSLNFFSRWLGRWFGVWLTPFG